VTRSIAVSVLIVVVAASVYAEGRQISRGEPDLLGQRAIAVGIAAFGLVGALLLYRRPDHRLGWLLAGIGTLALLGGSANEYVLAETGAGRSDTVFLAWLVWLSNWFWFPVIGGVFVLLPLLFPDGRPPSTRWRWVAVAGVMAILGLVLSSALQENYEATILGEISAVKNPLGIKGLTVADLSILYEISALIMLAAFVGSVASLGVRSLRSQGVERLQLKWFSYAVGLMLAWTIGEAVWEDLLEHDDLMGGSVFPFGLLLTFIPITIAVAILRYRLYAIDRIVSRTVSYGLVVGLLAIVYVTGVFVVQAILPGEQTDLAVAASTLAVAGLFTPLRNRLQALVDRRFNRSHYIAERVIEEFAGGLRDQVDLVAVATDLRLVVGRTVQPVTAEIWLRDHP
jgi:hypothetical protein